MGEQQDQSGIQWLSQLLEHQGLEASVTGQHVDDELGDSSFWLTIEDDSLTQAQVDGLLGDRGRVLDAIQYLANTVLNIGQEPDAQQSYTIELQGYRQQRRDELKAIAEKAAEQALATGEEHEVTDLSSAERRQVHTFLKAYGGLETFSRGREPDRRLVVRALGGLEPANGEDE
ncbi:single-stranded nucleic acid binding r3h domain-containing protein [Leptolyngbya sp. Heron Island J]|uniref:Jag family protein n=1 Tax=Leptolyngbya sp. Heron Island J TaxID=1385935 RepID=UPI0003B9A2C2|nr:R3H domain-containing nucleic acid-binding protein [Leptolyngbya sp. Heron Island J]ESA37576.1 single-stranded nucleic acid binding r3h domain-containing protein [Leptolyngbya sp. Heron Island J]